VRLRAPYQPPRHRTVGHAVPRASGAVPGAGSRANLRLENIRPRFVGSAYQLKGAVCEPKPLQKPHPPIMIGAAGEKLALRVVAQHANIWNCPTQTVAEFRHKNDVLGEHCAAIGRDPNDITRSVQLIVRCQDPAEPASTREHVLELINAGVTHIVLAAVACPGPPAHWLAETHHRANARRHAPLIFGER
jgi:alkanesulfonate monooxygenase SsuD/methylene tetrahydromethanopterin reductase-like flavin-dependent oxidoreductase (luciferase family)